MKFLEVSISQLEQYVQNESFLQNTDLVFIKFMEENIIDTDLYQSFCRLLKINNILSILIFISKKEELNLDIFHLNQICFLVKNIKEYKYAVNELTQLFKSDSEGSINIDLPDLKTITTKKSHAFLYVSEYTGENAAFHVVKESLIKHNHIKNASGVLVKFFVHPDFELSVLAEAMELIHESIHEDADVLFSVCIEKEREFKNIKYSMVLTQMQYIYALNNLDYKE